MAKAEGEAKRVQIKVSDWVLELVKKYAKSVGFTVEDAADKLINTGFGRLAALAKHAESKAGEVAPKKIKKKTEKKAPAKKEKKAPAKKAPKKKVSGRRRVKVDVVEHEHPAAEETLDE